MASIVTFNPRNGRTERTWVPRADEEWWLRFWGKQGTPAARLADYQRWGGFFPPHPESVDEVMIYPKAREAQRRRRSRLRS